MGKRPGRKGVVGVALVACVMAASGCDSQPTGPSSGDVDLVLAAVSASESLLATGSDASSGATVNCPAGGQILSEGDRTLEREDEVRVLRWDVTVQHEECGVEVNGSVLTITGEMQRSGEARFSAPTNGTATLLMHEAHQLGSKTLTRDGETFTCDLDLNVALDPDQERFVISGTACGREVEMRIRRPIAP